MQRDTDRARLPYRHAGRWQPTNPPHDHRRAGALRFRPNAIVCDLLDASTLDLNAIALGDYSVADREEFAMLIDYSVSGISDLSEVRDETINRIDAFAEPLYPLLAPKEGDQKG